MEKAIRNSFFSCYPKVECAREFGMSVMQGLVNYIQ